MQSQGKAQTLLGHIDAFANEIHCYLCDNLYKSPYTTTNCGHVYCQYMTKSHFGAYSHFCSECIQKYLKGGNTECPQCGVPIQGKSLTRNYSYSTMVQCISKIRNLLAGNPASQFEATPIVEDEIVEDQAETLISALSGLIDEEEEESEESKDFIKENIEVVPVESNVKQPSKEVTKMRPIEPSLAIRASIKKDSKSTKPPISNNKMRYGLLLTGLSEDQKQLVQSNLNNLSKLSPSGSIFKIVKEYSKDQVSHIICACAPKSHCPRTLKYLLGIAGKSWIVSFEWILESMRANKILEEGSFVVSGDEAVQCDTNACEKSRADKGKLFDGEKFYLAGLFNAPGPSKSDLAMLIETGGGILCKKIEPDAFVISNNSGGPKDGEKPYTWLFDCLSIYQISQ